MSRDLERLRGYIGTLDSKLVNLLNERASLSLEVGAAKRAQAAESSEVQAKDVYIPAQEKAVFEKLKKMNRGPLSGDSLCSIYREIMSASISLQKDVSIAYLGPAGSFTHQAAVKRFGDSITYKPYDNISDVFDAIEGDQVTYGIIPIENSTFGSVVLTLDRFIRSDKVQIRAETYLPIQQCLLSNFQKGAITKIYSQPVAFGQCQKWLDENLPGVERINVSSTSHAAELASREMYAAAVCSSVCADLYNLQIVQQDISDLRNNHTRFFIIGKNCDKSTGDDKTLLYFTVDHRQPGALCDGLKVFKDYSLNLTHIDSRPSHQRPWHYVFFVEFEGHKDDDSVKKALADLSNYCLDIVVLGSYPNQRPSNA
ncbi:bifunctional chorismate mutase/prephenate dehydratase P-protein [Basidiobolus meristosporus CBS 931.73]|uniref:Bifunctional chorismate mutase/prephenate dehydratase n=1 Tax=Basidiobolus meristosporus CBS 931.73 TaxID=1314790 RepID=A0A1Y1XHQ8_9FUNG|nr:bifunctional chorismate mutase/prephenate dehydratase P-protein [Basidiobolus meristosporus CBS 931.73]|eukprot:ORX85298.1 bifunctional chorismate mutase/prephenate dehydratase P-protein [Basidiobolus meristosporus CBS 931.73]